MKTSPLEGLTTVLQAEETLYAQLRDLLQEEQGLMATLDAEGLERIARSKEELADESRLVEETRLAVTRELAMTLGIEDEQPRLSTLCERIGREGDALREVHTRLVVLIGAVRELMDVNRAFAGEALSQVRGTLQLLGGLVPSQALYEAVPEREPRVSVGQLVRRSV